MIHQEEIDRHSRLFISIILQAVQDAGTKPTKEEQKQRLNLSANATSAMEYLFGYDSNVFAYHASLIGADAGHIKESLLNRDRPLNIENKIVTPENLRILRIRYRYHQNRSIKYV